jgi:hypothetical protein
MKVRKPGSPHPGISIDDCLGSDNITSATIDLKVITLVSIPIGGLTGPTGLCLQQTLKKEKRTKDYSFKGSLRAHEKKILSELWVCLI